MTVMQTRSTMTILARLMSAVTARRNQCTPVLPARRIEVTEPELRRVIDRVDRNFRARIVALLERIARPRLGVDERGDLLRLLVGEAPRTQIRHRVPDDPRQRVNARRAGAVVPRVGTPQRTGLLVADLHALAVGAMTRGAALRVERLAALRVELVDGNQLVGRDRVPSPPRRVRSDRI